jgi:hypothetical protein
MYILKLHLNLPTAGTKKFVSGNKFLCAYVKEVCRLGAQSHFVLRNTHTHTKLHRAIQNTRRGMLTSSVVLLHDNARPHTAARFRPLLEHFNWELFEHLPYSPDLAPSDYDLFAYLKNWLRS